MELTLAEQTLLIALDDVTGRDTAGRVGDVALAAALLLELADRELVTIDAEGIVAAVDAPAPDHALLSDTLGRIRDSAQRRDVKGWVSDLPREVSPLRTRVPQRLVERGVLAEKHYKRLGLVPTTRFPTADPTPEVTPRDRLHAILVDGGEPRHREALLIGLLEPLGLIDRAVPRPERREARRRAKAAAEQVAGTAVADAVRDVEAAVVAATVPSTSATTVSST